MHLKNKYLKIGKGFIIFENAGKEELFIDSFSDNENAGYIINNEQVITQLKEIFFEVINSINGHNLLNKN